MAKVERNSNLRQIAKELGIVGAVPTNQFDFASKANTGLRNEAVAATGSDIALNEQNLMKQINERLRTSGPATIRSLKDMFGDQIQSPVATPTPDVATKVNNIKQLQKSLQDQQLEQAAAQGVNPFAPPTTPGGTPMAPVEQSATASGGLNEFVNRLGNLTRGAVREVSDAPLAEIASTNPSRILPKIATGVGDLLNPVQGDEETILNRITSNLGKKVEKDVFKASTIEEEALKALSEKFPDLAADTKKKGLAKFAGAGEFKIKGNRYFIDEKGKLNKVGVGNGFLERISAATKPVQAAPAASKAGGLDIPETGENLSFDDGGASQIAQLVSDAQAAISQGADPNKVKERLAQLISQLQNGAK